MTENKLRKDYDWLLKPLDEAGIQYKITIHSYGEVAFLVTEGRIKQYLEQNKTPEIPAERETFSLNLACSDKAKKADEICAATIGNLRQ